MHATPPTPPRRTSPRNIAIALIWAVGLGLLVVALIIWAQKDGAGSANTGQNAEDTFLAQVHEHAFTSATDEELLEAGHDACSMLQGGADTTTVSTSLVQQNAWVESTGVAVAEAAQAYLCADDSDSAPDSFVFAPLAHAKNECAAGQLADEDTTLIIDVQGEDLGSGSTSFDALFCVLDELDTPSYVISQIENTRALDGMQSANWESYTAQWTYHPDQGLDLTIHQED
jgi:hypothetical protein